MKILALLACAAAASVGGMAVGRLTYTPFQFAYPVGSGLKVTTEPAGIWSYHNQFQISNLPHVERVLVDIDGNGRMDTEIDAVRVLITDIQVYATGVVYPLRLKDSQGAIWELSLTGPNNGIPLSASHHLSTPLALDVGSDLFVELGSSMNTTVSIHIIGRVVNL
jgi:hypothetical protein